MVGIYKITNKINNKIYVGQSIDIQRRWEEHKFYSKDDTVLQHAFSKYGINNFIFEIIEECNIDELDEKEIYWISYYDSFENGYNMNKGGNNHQFLNYEEILFVFKETKSIHKTAEITKSSRTSVRKILEIFNIDYEKEQGVPIQIVMVDPITLKELKVFNSIVEAATFVKTSDSAIRKALKKDNRYSSGFLWKKYNEDIVLKPLKKIPADRKKKIIEQYDLNNNKINEYKTLAEANLAIGKKETNASIGLACRGQKDNAYGYIWKYKEV